MPILRKESEIFPPDLFALPAQPWEIVHVQSRQEKVLARLLGRHAQPFYLPQIEKRIERSGRSFTSFLPLFAGYVFLRRTEETRKILWSSGVAARVFTVVDQSSLNDELRQIRALQLAGATLVPQIDLMPGERVLITEGVFSGYTGTVVRRRDAVCLLVTVSSLNNSVLAEFPQHAIARHHVGTRAKR